MAGKVDRQGPRLMMTVSNQISITEDVYKRQHPFLGRRSEMQYEYFYGAQAEQFSFYRIPKALFTEPNFRELSTDATEM